MPEIDKASLTRILRQWRAVSLPAIVVTVAVALVYSAAELWRTGSLGDWALILFGTINAVILYWFANYMAPWLYRMFGGFPSAAEQPDKAVARVLGHPFQPLSGFVYASGIAAAIWFLGPWTDDPVLRGLLALFMFASNVIFGMALWGVAQYWRAVLAELPRLDLRIMNLSRPPVLFILRVNSQVVTFTAVVVSLSILAIVLSDLDEEPTIILFSGGLFLLVVAAYLVPVLPLSNRLRLQKAAELDRVERMIDARLRRLLGQPPRSDGPAEDEELPDLDKLTEARDLIARVRTLPPGGQVSVSAAAIVTFLSFMPALIDYLLSNLELF